MTVPIELIVFGKPSSVNKGTALKKFVWKNKVSASGNAELTKKYGAGPYPAPYLGEVTVKVFYFPSNAKYIDIDNGLKHTIDALCKYNGPLPPPTPFSPILDNDKTVCRLVVERFAPVPKSSLVVPASFAPTIALALLTANGLASMAIGGPAKKQQATAIKMEPYISSGELW